MSLRTLAELDNKAILEDTETGFAWDISLTSPNEVTEDLTGYSNSISQVIDPDTGQVISAKAVSVAINISSILEVFTELPKGIADAGIKPWIVTFQDLAGTPKIFKVEKSNPDETLGMITLILEAYES